MNRKIETHSTFTTWSSGFIWFIPGRTLRNLLRLTGSHHPNFENGKPFLLRFDGGSSQFCNRNGLVAICQFSRFLTGDFTGIEYHLIALAQGNQLDRFIHTLQGVKQLPIQTEPIGSIPRPQWLIDELIRVDGTHPSLDELYCKATEETVHEFEATGSPVISDGEQRKFHNFWTYSVHGLANTSPDGFKIPFSAGHTRRMLRLTAGPFTYKRYADEYLATAQKYAHVPVKQAVISASALSLMYPAEEIPGYTRDEFVNDLLAESEKEIRNCLNQNAHKVQVDFTEARLAVKLDPTGNLLQSFIDLNNLVFARFSSKERQKIGVHTCPGSDCDSTHSGDVDYAQLLPSLFQLNVDNFYIALAGEHDRRRVLKIIKENMKPSQTIFVGVISTIDPHIETPEEVRDRILEAVEFIPVEQLATTDDCGFSPFCDDRSTSRDTAFAKIRARVIGTQLADRVLGGNA